MSDKRDKRDEPLNEAASLDGALPDKEADEQIRRMTRRGLLVMAGSIGAGIVGYKWLRSRPRDAGVEWPLRRTLEVNERLSRAYFSRARLSPTFSKNDITRARINGHQGLDVKANHSTWRLNLEGLATGVASVGIAEIRALPRREMITELRCIEGWSTIVQWTGARLSDLMTRFPPITRDGRAPNIEGQPENLASYVSMETPGRGYYVGLDMESALHPQTLLVYEMNGQPLNWHHGAPLRLAIPVKYGIKNIKRIGTIRYTNVRPADFWADRGYDWYAGH